MIEMRIAKAGEEGLQKTLWKLAFGDEDSYIDAFYDHCYEPGKMLVLLEDGVLASMAAFLPMTLELPEGGTRAAAYIYAFATHPGAQHKGFGRQLLNYADYYLKEQGFDCVCLMPAEVSLHRFFESVGYDECFATRKLERMCGAVAPYAVGDSLEPLGAAEYNALRNRLLAGTFYMAYEDSWVAHQKSVSLASGADLFRVTVGDTQGVTAIEFYDEDSILMKELLIDPRKMDGALALVKARYPAMRYHVRTPGCWDGPQGSYGQAFAMVKWYHKADAAALGPVTQGYFGLALD